MNRNLYIILLSSILLLTTDLKAQEQYLDCPQSMFSFTTATVPTTVNQTTTTMISMGISNSASAYLIAGNTYKLATNLTFNFNPVMTVFDNIGFAQAFNDDGGFLEEAEIYFTPLSTGDYSIQINEYGYTSCGSGSGLPNLQITLVAEPQPAITIPVVIHVVHYGEAIGTGRNISDAQIQDQIATLNTDFSRSNIDILSAPPVFRGVSANANVQFCLAQQDDNGNTTDGIVRYDASSMTGGKASWSQAECDSIIKPNTIWNPEDYLNIWVVDFDTSATGLLGFAKFPETMMNTVGVFDPNIDGIVMNYKAFGTSPNNFPGYNVGRTLTHETGHYLGLWHTFMIPGDCTMDDQCSDTPLQSDETFGCPTTWTPSICINFPAMSNNFMDYVNQDCMNMFTYNQKVRMQYFLATDRITLLSSNGCTPLTPIYGCTDPSACNYDPLANTNDGSCAYPTSNSITLAACDSYTWSVNSTTYSTSGTYSDVSTNAAGCDHTETLNLTINNSTSSSSTETACDSYTWSVNGTTYTTSGTYTDVSTNAAGCDSTVVLNLTINHADTSYTNITACDSVVWNGTTYTQSGTYSINVTSNNDYSMSFDGGNDYVDFFNPATFDFILNSSYSISFNFMSNTIGNSAIISFGDMEGNYQNRGLFIGLDVSEMTVVIRGDAGNGSDVSVSFPFNQNQFYNVVVVRDYGNNLSLWVDGNLVDIDSDNAGLASPFTEYRPLLLGIHQEYLSGSPNYINGYDGNIDNLEIWNTALNQQEIQNYMTCPPTGTESGLIGYWNFEEGPGSPGVPVSNVVLDQTSNGNTGVRNGAIYDTNVPLESCGLTNVNGCDSTAILNLTINSSTSNSTSVTACESYTWGDQVYDTSGTYVYTTTNVNGCDSTATLDLTIMPGTNTTSSVDATSCDSITWNGNTYTTSGTYTWTGVNAVGCDSIVTLNFTSGDVTPVITQVEDSLYSTVNPSGTDYTAQWLNIDPDTKETWLMGEEKNFGPRFDCNYILVTTTENGCIDTTDVYFFAEFAGQIYDLKVSPNPTRGLINIKYVNERNQFVRIYFANSNGVVLDEFISSENEMNIDISNYPSGIYYVYFSSEEHCSSAEQQITRKIILNK